jgi:hypothetical protein
MAESPLPHGPRCHLLLYHSVLAPHAAWRSRVVRFARPTGETAAEGPSVSPGVGGRQRYQTWAALMQRVFRPRPQPVCASKCRGSTQQPSTGW